MVVAEICGTLDCPEKHQVLKTWVIKQKEQFLEAKGKLMMEIKELDAMIKKQGDDLSELKEYHIQLEKKQRKEDAATNVLKCEEKLLKDKNDELQSEVDTLKNKIEEANQYKPSIKDAAVLQKCRLKYQLYKSTTGVRWDYSVKSTHGYVVNKTTYYTQPFSLTSSNEDYMWEEISKASSADWSAFSCNET